MATCAHCGEENPERARFCLACGTPLGDGTPLGEERKVVSILFVDLVGFTASSDQVDPEDVGARIRPYHRRVKQEIERFGGTVEKFIGDAVMAAFGAPVAHEDDAERAVRAGLRVFEAIDELNAESPGLQLTTSRNGGITTRDVASGKLDRYIRGYARDVKQYGRPFLITLFNGEFNGDWWYGVSPLVNPAITTDDFVRAWRRIVDIFRAVGARNASWSWVVNGYPATPLPNIDADIGAYYPDDDYVDWAGADVNDVGTPSWLDGPYAFAVAHGKPLFVAEFGIRHEWSTLTPPQQQVWLDAMFDYFESHPAVKAISYFNYNNRPGGSRVVWDPSRAVYLDGGRVSYLPDVNDHDSRLLAGGPQIRALFARRISSPRYVSSIATEVVEAQPQEATVTLLAPTIRARTAVLRWRGNLAADTVDIAVRRSRAWRTVATRLASATYVIRGQVGERIRVRVRARDVFGAAGAWGPPLTIRLAAR